MFLQKMEHILILAKNIEVTNEFYENILGLKGGYRPPFLFSGYWMYLDSTAIIHLAPSGNDEERNRYLSMSEKIEHDSNGSGAIDHIAFSVKDVNFVSNKLDEFEIPYIKKIVPEEDNLLQIFFKDPNGITIELNFRK